MVYNLNEFRAKIRAEKARATYADLEEDYGVNRYYLWHIINRDDYVPPYKAQEKLGIKIFRPAPACQKCGKVHAIDGICLLEVKVRLVRTKPREYHDLFSIPTAELRRMIEERSEA